MSVTGHPVRRVERSRPLRLLGRFGEICYGVVYLVVAWLALQIAFGDRATEADQRGAVTSIAVQPYGMVLLWVVAFGLVAFGVWGLLSAALEGHERVSQRFSRAGRGAVALAIAVFTVRLLVTGRGGGGDNAGQQELTARLLGLPGGRVLVFVLGLGVVVAAVLSGRRAVKRRFLRDLNLSGASTWTRRSVRWLGMLGFLAKGVAYAVIGLLLCTAAVHLDPNRAGGLDKALRTLATQPFGIVLLGAVTLGFAAFGAYCFADARYRTK